MDFENSFESNTDFDELNGSEFVETTAGTNYKCPNCGAPIVFNADEQMYICDFCLSRFTIEAMDIATRKKQADIDRRLEKKKDIKLDKNELEAEVVQAYHCENCGADVISTDTNLSSYCYYCHSPVVFSDRLLGEKRPDEIIPFSIGKENAQAKFLDWAKNKRYIPKEFTTKAYLENMTGVYMPYWFLDSDIDVDFIGNSRSVRSWRIGDFIETEVTDYKHIRKGKFYLNDVNIVGSDKIDLNLLNGIEPYDASDIQKFSMPLLSGYLAEGFTVSGDDAEIELQHYTDDYANELLNRSFGFTGQIESIKKDFDINQQLRTYVMLPVWVLTYKYEDKIYVYAVNGSTGKSSGELPLVKKKLLLDTIGIGLLVFIIIAIIAFLIFNF